MEHRVGQWLGQGGRIMKNHRRAKSLEIRPGHDKNGVHMATHRKFNAHRFFEAFKGHEDELSEIFTAGLFPAPDPFDVDSARQAVLDAPDGEADELVALLHELNDLATPVGRDIVGSVALEFGLADAPGEDVTPQRVAGWLLLSDREAFDHALDLLAARAVRGNQIALFQGTSAARIDDPAQAVGRLRAKLDEVLPREARTERFEVRHYTDGQMLVVLVFCERTAEVQLEFESGGRSVKSSIRRPVSQDVLFYNQRTGELEIESGRPKHRELLRAAVAEAVFHDEDFFPREEASRTLDLGKLREIGFRLQTATSHTARITGIKFTGQHLRSGFSLQCMGGRTDAIDVLRARGALEGMHDLRIDYARVELVLGTGRSARKVIELSGTNRIKFNRESHADEVYDYLRNWGLMRIERLEGGDAG